MRLVMFASAIAFGCVAGLSQASDWRQPVTDINTDIFDLVILSNARNLSSNGPDSRATTNKWQEAPRTSYDIGPAYGYMVFGAASSNGRTGAGTDGAYGLGLALPLSDQFWVSGEALGPDLREATFVAHGARSSKFVVRAAFRF